MKWLRRVFLPTFISINVSAAAQESATDNDSSNNESCMNEDIVGTDDDVNYDIVDVTNDDGEESLWEKFNCVEAFQRGSLPIHGQPTWMLLRGLYHGIVGPEESSIAPLSFDSGVAVPIQVGHAPGKGRAVFASSEVKKGSVVWSTRQTARFYDEFSYLQFLEALPPAIACDVIQWAYVQDVELGFDGKPLDPSTYDEEDIEIAITVDFDEGILLNQAEYEYEGQEEFDHEYPEVTNVGCDEDAAKSVKGGCGTNYFALRDIEAGEELLIRYGDFAIGDGWEEFNIIRK